MSASTSVALESEHAACEAIAHADAFGLGHLLKDRQECRGVDDPDGNPRSSFPMISSAVRVV
jgi:hypothetical protein